MNCRVCAVPALPFLSLNTDELSEPFLDETLCQAFSELELHRCPNCNSLWGADGRQNPELLLEAYRRVADSYFSEQADDLRFVAFYQWLGQWLRSATGQRRILDVGCGDGAFLAALSEDWIKWGVEPSEVGATRAVARNLRVTHGTLESCLVPAQVDIVTMLDVIEHLVDPHQLVEACKRRLAPGGLLLVVTGDADSWSARKAGPQWSYLRWCGHISVFSRRGLTRLFTDHGFEIVEWRSCDHPASSGAIAWWRVHLFEPARRAIGRRRSWYPFWRDHQAILIRRAENKPKDGFLLETSA